MTDLHDTGNGVMMPPKSLHAPREWDRMLIEAQKKRIDDLEKAMDLDCSGVNGNAVNNAGWKLNELLTDKGPLNGHQFNNLKPFLCVVMNGYFKEVLNND